MANNELKNKKARKQDADRENILEKCGVSITDIWNKSGK